MLRLIGSVLALACALAAMMTGCAGQLQDDGVIRLVGYLHPSQAIDGSWVLYTSKASAGPGEGLALLKPGKSSSLEIEAVKDQWVQVDGRVKELGVPEDHRITILVDSIRTERKP
jgi:hypothetical protein